MRTRKFRQCISYLLICVLFLQLLPPGSLWHTASASAPLAAATLQDSIDTVVPRLDNTVSAEIPPTFIDETSDPSGRVILPKLTEENIRYVDIISANTLFSSLDETEKAFLCEYTKGTGADFETLEARRVSLAQSATLIRLAVAFGFSA